MRNRCVLIWMSIVAAALTGAGGLALPAGAQQPRSLDDELLEDLGGDPLEEFDRELVEPQDEQGRAGQSPAARDEALPGRLQRELGAAAVSEDDNPLLEVARRMRTAEALIAQSELGRATLNVQQQIVVDLEELIKQARKQCKSGGKPGTKPGAKQGQQVKSDTPAGPPIPKSGSGGGKQPGPTIAGRQDTPNPAPAPVQGVDMGQMQDVIRKLWGQLPQRERERMTQSPPEEFLPKYEFLIEQYYRRLAEEKQP
ncbi:MAG: hypothetical protein JXB62_05985 [Pirellulales bacterium]|nr:hypothetical protein [Pirellulales bacterium]